MLIVLIGPPGAGKSSVGELLAAECGLRFVEADTICSPYYEEVGWSVDRLLRLAGEIGFERAHEQWEVALTHAVERLMDIHPDAVVALGAGHSHVTQAALFNRIAKAMATANDVVLLRPDPDSSVSIPELRRRCIASKGHDWIRDGVDWIERWSTDGRDEQLATHTAYTAGETAAGTAARISAGYAARGGSGARLR